MIVNIYNSTIVVLYAALNYSAVDWSSKELCEPIYDLFLGSSLGTADQKRTPSCTRIRLKLLQYLSRATRDGIIFPQCVKVRFHTPMTRYLKLNDF